MCLPFGGPKGAALSMLMDVLCGVLTGANYGGEVRSLYFDFEAPQNVGHFFLAIKPDLFMPRAEYEARMDNMVERVKAQPRAAGVDEILMPGEPESRKKREYLDGGIPPDGRHRRRRQRGRRGHRRPVPAAAGFRLGLSGLGLAQEGAAR